MNTWVLETQRNLNRHLTSSEKKVLEYLNEKNIEIKINEPFSISNYRTTNICFVDFLLQGKIALEIDGTHHRTDISQFQIDKEKREKLWKEYFIPTIRIPNEVIEHHFLGLQTLLDALCGVLSYSGKKLNRAKKNIYSKQDWYEVENYLTKWHSGENKYENRLRKRSFIKYLNPSGEIFNNYQKIKFQLTNGIEGFFWKLQDLDLDLRIGDYVKFNEADKPGKYYIKKLKDGRR